MPKFDYDLIVIGAGAGGLTASTFAGQSAAKTLLIEREKKLGGDCLHYGCVPSKSLIKSAYVYNTMKHAEKYGLPNPTVDKVDYKQVSKRIADIIGTIQAHDEPEYIREHYNVETRFGVPRFVDAHTVELKNENITSRYFVIATGSAPFVPPIEGIQDVHYITNMDIFSLDTLRPHPPQHKYDFVPPIEGIQDVHYITNMDIFSLDTLPASMIVVGGGPIGMEMAQSFHRLGSKVTVVETTDCILPREDLDISCYVHELLEREGLTILTKARANKVEQQGDRIRLTVELGGKTDIIEAHALLMATGRRANTADLNLEKAGVVFDKRGIQVNKKMQTSQSHIYAVGDVAGGYQFTHVASYEAVVAIYNAILKIPKKTDYSKTPWCTYLDPQVASIGYNEKAAKKAGIEYIAHVEEIAHNDRALAEGENKGRIKIVMNKKGKVIGVQIVSYHAGDLIAEWIPVLNGSGKLSAISEAIHPYPTMSEINKNASVNYLVSTIPVWTKKLTKFLFGYQGKV